MNELDAIRRLDAAAAGAPPGRIDVAGRVLAEIRLRRSGGERETVFWAAAGVAAAVAVVMAAVAAWTWADWHDPLGELFGPVVMVMQ